MGGRAVRLAARMRRSVARRGADRRWSSSASRSSPAARRRDRRAAAATFPATDDRAGPAGHRGRRADARPRSRPRSASAASRCPTRRRRTVRPRRRSWRPRHGPSTRRGSRRTRTRASSSSTSSPTAARGRRPPRSSSVPRDRPGSRPVAGGHASTSSAASGRRSSSTTGCPAPRNDPTAPEIQAALETLGIALPGRAEPARPTPGSGASAASPRRAPGRA